MRRLVALTLVLLVIPASLGATWYVRVGGDDLHCDGTTSDPYDPVQGGQQSCAFATVGEALGNASCGDDVDVGEGHFYDLGQVSVTLACSASSPLVIHGAGLGATYWHPRSSEVTNCADDPGRANTYVCDWTAPSGTTVPLPTGVDLLQRNAQQVYWSTNTREGDMSGAVKLTETTTSADDLPAREGHYYVDTAAGKVYIHPWNEVDITSANTIIAPGENVTSSGKVGFLLSGASYITLRDMTLEVSGGYSVSLTDCTNITVTSIESWGGTIQTATSSGANDAHLFEHVTVNNYYSRPHDSTSAEFTYGQGIQNTDITNSTFRYITIYACREGFSFSGSSADDVLDGAVIHGCYNHGLKIQDNAHDIEVRDIITYNNQEGFYTNCSYNLTFRHCMFNETFLIQGDPGGCPTNQPRNIDVFNSILHKVSWLSYSNPRANGGYDFDGNLYVDELPDNGGDHSTDPPRAGSKSTWQYSETSTYYYGLAEVQANAGSDPCTDCTNEPNGYQATDWEDVFVHYARRDLQSDVADWHLKAGSAAIDVAYPAYTNDTTDLDGNARQTPYDDGPYDEHSTGGGEPSSPAWRLRFLNVRLGGCKLR